jgi:hypothetical protein
MSSVIVVILLISVISLIICNRSEPFSHSWRAGLAAQQRGAGCRPEIYYPVLVFLKQKLAETLTSRHALPLTDDLHHSLLHPPSLLKPGCACVGRQ